MERTCLPKRVYGIRHVGAVSVAGGFSGASRRLAEPDHLARVWLGVQVEPKASPLGVVQREHSSDISGAVFGQLERAQLGHEHPDCR